MKRFFISLGLILAVVLVCCKFSWADDTKTADAAVIATNSAPVNLPADIVRAGAEHKAVLLHFTGSDWCPMCILFEKEVLSKPEFLAYAKSNLVFADVDFPHQISLPPNVAATNDMLAAQFDVYALPTFVMLNSNGREIWRMPAKDDPNPGFPTSILNPKAFISLLEEVRKNQK